MPSSPLKKGVTGSLPASASRKTFENTGGQAARGTRRSAGGFLSLELALTLPILGMVLMGTIEFSMLFLARSTIVDACRAGARMASLPGVVSEDVQAEVRRFVGPRFRNSVRVDLDAGTRSGDVVTVAVRVPMRRASPDLLWPIGFSLSGRELYAESRIIKE